MYDFVGDMYRPDDTKDGAEEPDWVKTERDNFVEFRDRNKDNKMDKEEIRQWVLPNDYNPINAEARHLMYKADKDEVRNSTTFPFACWLLLVYVMLSISHTI